MKLKLDLNKIILLILSIICFLLMTTKIKLHYAILGIVLLMISLSITKNIFLSISSSFIILFIVLFLTHTKENKSKKENN